MSKLVIFGTGSFAECAQFYFDNDSPHEVVAFTVHGDHIESNELGGLPVVAFEELGSNFAPDSHEMFVAVGYKDVNRVRARICEEAKGAGYSLATYVSTKATTWPGLVIGENCFVFEDNTIQPFGRIGNDVVLWSGNHIGHHHRIGDHCFITSHVVVSGHVEIGAYSFIGVNATLRDAITIGEANVIGAGALIMKSTADKEVYTTPRTKAIERTSDEIGM
jgi:sugar O-acyltransferase (sialic acid O-acetyltransferase NeuD family)